MAATHQIVGNAVCMWDDDTPLIWTMSESGGQGIQHSVPSNRFDLAKLTEDYDQQFLMNLKDLLLVRRKRVALVSVHAEYVHIRALLTKMRDAGLVSRTLTQIDAPFLLALSTIVGEVAKPSLAALKRLFCQYRDAPLFAPDLLPDDFPVKKSGKGYLGDIQSRILASALSRAACVEILRVADEAFEAGKIDVGQYSFINLCFHVYVRPYSYCSLVLSDLQVDIHRKTGVRNYFLWITPVKTGVALPAKYSVPLHRMVGELLEANRIHVVKKYGHLVAKEEIGQLALFPARKLNKDGNWVSAYARANRGAYPVENGDIGRGYFKTIKKLLNPIQFNFNGLRHTVGTQLAEVGCSAATIQAVLKHAGDRTCQAYVDICFHGLVANLSNSVRADFEKHYPVHAFRSKHEPIAPEKAIRSEDLETGRVELTGECGRQIACQYAPIACYACWRFIPCVDADHTINLDVVDREIERCNVRGLPFKTMLERSKDARRYIMLVVAAVEQKRHAEAQGALT